MGRKPHPLYVEVEPSDLPQDEQVRRFIKATNLLVEASKRSKAKKSVNIEQHIFFTKNVDRYVVAWLSQPHWYLNPSSDPFDRFVAMFVEEAGFVDVELVCSTLELAAVQITPDYDQAAGRVRINLLRERLAILYEFLRAQPNQRKSSKPKKDKSPVTTETPPGPTTDQPTVSTLDLPIAEGICTYANNPNPKLMAYFYEEGLRMYDELMVTRGLPIPDYGSPDDKAGIAQEVRRRIAEVLRADDIRGGDRNQLLQIVIDHVLPTESGVEITWR